MYSLHSLSLRLNVCSNIHIEDIRISYHRLRLLTIIIIMYFPGT